MVTPPHSKNFATVEMARDNSIIMHLQLPSHTTHRLQLLDDAVFKPLETYYNQAVERMRVNPGLAVTQFQVAELLGEAYGKATTIANSINGFRKCGIWPVN